MFNAERNMHSTPLGQARPALYGADFEGTFFPPPEEEPIWNLRALPDLLRTGPTCLSDKMGGVNTPFLYFGQWKCPR